jgi:hypothetical protein
MSPAATRRDVGKTPATEISGTLTSGYSGSPATQAHPGTAEFRSRESSDTVFHDPDVLDRKEGEKSSHMS